MPSSGSRSAGSRAIFSDSAATRTPMLGVRCRSLRPSSRRMAAQRSAAVRPPTWQRLLAQWARARAPPMMIAARAVGDNATSDFAFTLSASRPFKSNPS